MHKNYKKIVAGLMAAVMIAPTAISISEPQKASAYELLGETTFDYKMLPWHTVEASPARQTFELTEGAVKLTIVVPEGADREKWDLQFRHRNLSFKAGHEYKVSFKSKAKREGMELTSYIGDLTGSEEYFVLDGSTNDMHMGPDMGGQWPQSCVKLTTEWQTYEGIFKPLDDIEVAQWTFQYAKGTKYQGNAMSGDELWFDDMSIEDLTDKDYVPPAGSFGYTTRGTSGLANNYISVNQLGYYTGLAKNATLSDNSGDVLYGAESIELTDSYDYEIVRVSDDKTVYTGKTDKPKKDADSGDNVCRIDFTAFDEVGEYYIRIKGKEWRSFPFKIGTDIYSSSDNHLLTNALNYFYQNRSGEDIRADYITSGEKDKLAHTGVHKTDTGYVQTQWVSEYLADSEATDFYASSKLDASGGWYKADDHSKNMTEGGISVWTLQNMYERAVWNGKDKKFADGSGTVVIPESGNKYPDILDECRYELDFMSRMKVQPDEKTWGKYSGMYYHSINDHRWHSLTDRPDYDSYDDIRIIKPPTFAATLNYAACAAQGARLWAPYDAEYANELLASAKEAYQAYKVNWYIAAADEYYNKVSFYAPNTLWKGTNFYPDIEVVADAYWAACEIFISAKEMEDKDADTYLTELSENRNAFKVPTKITGGDIAGNLGSYTMFNWGNIAAAGSMSLMLHSELLSNEQAETLNDSFLQAADDFIETEAKQGYGIPYKYDGPGYFDMNGLDFDVRYSGFEYGSNERALNNMFAMAYAYDLTGDKKYINGVTTGMDYLLGNNPLTFSFITGYGSYCAKNPSHEYWQYEIDKSLPQAPDGVIVSGPSCDSIKDPYLYALGYEFDYDNDPSERYYVDSVESWSTNEASLSSNASLAWIVSFLQDEASTENPAQPASGDVNADGEFSIADVLLVQKWVIGDKRYALNNWKAADFCADGKLDIFDLTRMKKKFIKNSFKDCVLPEKSLRYGNPMNVVTDGLELRLGPDESYEVINTIPARTRIDELGYNLDNDHWMFTEYKGRYGWIKTVKEDNKTATVYPDAVAAKPVIYLYPEKETDVHVELELTEAELSTTYPKYNNGWDVTAYPDGTLLNKADGTHHKYLFWDAVHCRTRFDFSKGFCVAGSDTESFLKEKLTYMGLTEEEMNEFIVYWLPLMEHNKYNLISFQGEAYTDSAKLNIMPKPDSLLRIFMTYVPLEEEVDIQPQQLETFDRNGFTVVEWGGSEIKS